MNRIKPIRGHDEHNTHALEYNIFRSSLSPCALGKKFGSNVSSLIEIG